MRAVANEISQKAWVQPPFRVIERREHRGTAPLSHAQMRMWYLSKLHRVNGAYNILLPLRLRGVFKVSVLERSITEMVRRHESLRTTFIEAGDEPMQVIHAPYPAHLVVVDLRHLRAVVKVGEAKRLLEREAGRPFTLSSGPLLRSVVVVLENGHHFVLFAMHHIVADAWSTALFLKELSALYRAFREGQPSPLPELKIQYADFAKWQRESTDEKRDASQIDYWLAQLRDAPPLSLPTDYRQCTVDRLKGAWEYFVIPSEAAEALVQFARQQRTTLFVVLISALFTLLYHWTGQNILLIGTSVSTRTDVEVERLIGCFPNTVALRMDVSDELSFVELLGRVRERTIEALVNRDVPFEKVMRALRSANPEMPVLRLPIMFEFEQEASESFDVPGLEMEWLQLDYNTAKSDLNVLMHKAGVELIGWAEYSTALFDRATIRLLLEQLVHLLSRLPTDADEDLASLLSRSDGERDGFMENFLEDF